MLVKASTISWKVGGTSNPPMIMFFISDTKTGYFKYLKLAEIAKFKENIKL